VSKDVHLAGSNAPADEQECTLVSESCTNVPNGTLSDGEPTHWGGGDANSVDSALDEARRAWDSGHNERELRRALLDILRRLDDGWT
jgi:hypothetical protein